MNVNRLTLTESVGSATHASGTRWKARIIEGDRWGSSAYYPMEVLERDGARVFKAGLHMYQNHISESERWDRPEGSVENLVGVLTTDAWVEDDGLYAEVEFYESYASRITEIHRDIGLSVRAHGLTEDAEMDGRYGPVLVSLLAADSVDVVTKAGAGGKLTSIIEADRNLAGTPITESQEGTQSVTDVTKADFDQLRADIVEAIASIPSSLAEALKPASDDAAEAAAKAAAEAKVEEVEDEVEIDHAAVLTAVTEAELPSAAIPAIVAALKGGTELTEAVKAQTDYRDALAAKANAGSGVVVLNESGAQLTGLARAVQVLGN